MLDRMSVKTRHMHLQVQETQDKHWSLGLVDWLCVAQHQSQNSMIWMMARCCNQYPLLRSADSKSTPQLL